MIGLTPFRRYSRSSVDLRVHTNMSISTKINSLDDLFDHASTYARFTLQESGNLEPTILILANDGSIIFLTGDTFDDRAKDKFIREARLVCIAYAAQAVAFVSEAWMS